MTTATTTFDRDSWASHYAQSHFETDEGICEIHYLPTGAPDREIRLLEVNRLIAVRESDPLQPIDFGVDRDYPTAHTLLILDVTPDQWERIKNKELNLPESWSLESKVTCSKDAV